MTCSGCARTGSERRVLSFTVMAHRAIVYPTLALCVSDIVVKFQNLFKAVDIANFVLQLCGKTKFLDAAGL